MLDEQPVERIRFRTTIPFDSADGQEIMRQEAANPWILGQGTVIYRDMRWTVVSVTIPGDIELECVESLFSR